MTVSCFRVKKPVYEARLMDIIDTLALTMGAAWASGINLYAAVFMLGYLGSTGHITLPPDLQVLPILWS